VNSSVENKFKVVIVGAGPAGIGIAIGLAKGGIQPIALIDRADRIGGLPAKYVVKKKGIPTFMVWTRARVLFGQQYVEFLQQELDRTDTRVHLNAQVISVNKASKEITLVSPDLGRQVWKADSIVFACGARERTITERGWISGKRPARVYHTMQLLDLLDGNACLPMKHPVILGSDLIAYSAAAKLRIAGAEDATMLDKAPSPKSNPAERLYFRWWCQPTWTSNKQPVSIQGSDGTKTVETKDGRALECDGVVVSGELLPNSELAAAAGLEVSMPNRLPILKGKSSFSEPGWFATGNVIGGFHGAQWCYFHGRKVAKSVVDYLTR